MCQADGIGALNADSDSFSRVVNLDLDKIILERNAELLSDHQTGELQFFRHFLSLPPLDGVIVRAKLAFLRLNILLATNSLDHRWVNMPHWTHSNLVVNMVSPSLRTGSHRVYDLF